MESCPSYKPWHDKLTGRTFLKPESGWCLHYYFYLIDEDFGLCYLRVPTWCPFRPQVYFNGHNWLAAQLSKRRIGFTVRDNAFIHIADWKKAQQRVARPNGKTGHRWLDRLGRRYCPVVRHLGVNYHWSVMQAEYSTDLVFRRQRDLEAIYDTLTRAAIHTVKPEHVATFLGRKLGGRFEDELGNDFHTRIEGTCIKHHMGPVSLKM